jgi:hypothetical protein
MKNTVKFRFAGIGIMIAMYAVFGAAVMLLWNVLMPQIFGLMKELNYLQATGLLVLGRLLFGGLGGGWHERSRGMGRGHPCHHGNDLREKWMNMSDDERKEFMRSRGDFSHFHGFVDERSDGRPDGRERNATGSEGVQNTEGKHE